MTAPCSSFILVCIGKADLTMLYKHVPEWAAMTQHENNGVTTPIHTDLFEILPTPPFLVLSHLDTWDTSTRRFQLPETSNEVQHQNVKSLGLN